MAIRFFADHCVPASVARRLVAAGHDVLLLRDHLPTNAPDQVVIAKAQELDAILLSVNGDFADIVTYPPTDYGGIIALQLRNHPETAGHAVARLNDYLTAHPERSNYVGKLLIVEPHRIRSRS